MELDGVKATVSAPDDPPPGATLEALVGVTA